MNNKTRAEIAVVIALRHQQEEGGSGMTWAELLEAAQKVPVAPPRLHRMGNAILKIFGRQSRPYQPDYSWDLHPTLMMLEDAGVLDSDYYPPDAPAGQRLLAYRLTGRQQPPK